MATPKKKHLIELMIEAGVKWPEGAEYAAQDNRDLYVWFYSEKPKLAGVNKGKWTSDVNYENGRKCRIVDGEKLNDICRNWHQTIVTREQYAKAIAKMKPAEQIDTQQKTQYCTSVMRQMPSETIESLLTEIKAKHEEHSELLAKAEALALEIASIEQQVANKLKEYGFSLYPVASSSETKQPVITDWRDLRVGDVIKCMAYGDERDNANTWPGGWARNIVDTIHIVGDIDPDTGKISLQDTQDSGYAFRFIYRP